MPGSSLLEQARRQAKGQLAERNDWNEVTVGNKTFTMEYPLPNENNKNILSTEDLNITSAFVKKENKVKCELCTMWFDRKSVIYQVPNHRILELRKQWNYIQSGRRYASASYLYGNSLVCCFCSQFLSTTEDNTKSCPPQEKSTLFGDLGNKSIQLYQTPITRKNISINCKTYQSSEVDSHISCNAIVPPYILGSKTRREVDPWYEVDLGKTLHVHSVSLTIKGPTQQNVNLHVLLLRGPVGFENPFLDSVKETAVYHKVVQIPCSVIAKHEDVMTIFPPHSIGGAIRIQLEGLQTLHIFRFQAFQGDQIITEAPPMVFSPDPDGLDPLPYPDFITDGDAQIRYDTFAAYPPQTFKATKSLHETSKSRKKSKTGTMLTRVSNSVWKLNIQYETRKEFVSEWKRRSLAASKYFTFDELLALRDIIFNPAVASTMLSNNPHNSISPPKSPMSILKKALTHKNRPNSPSDLRSLAPVIRAQDLYTTALMETHPRCHFDALVKAIHAASLLCQGRDTGGEIGVLQNSPRFIFLTSPSDDFNVFDKFQVIIGFLKDTICKYSSFQESSSPLKTTTTTTTSIISDGQNNFECSWSQFIIIVWLLSCDKPEDIPPLAFNTYEDWDLMKSQLQSAAYAASLRPTSSSNKSRMTQRGVSSAAAAAGGAAGVGGAIEGMPSTPIKTRSQLTIQTNDIHPTLQHSQSYDGTIIQTPLSRQNSSSPLPRTPVTKKQSSHLSPSSSTVSGSINSEDIRQITKQFKSGGGVGGGGGGSESRVQTANDMKRSLESLSGGGGGAGLGGLGLGDGGGGGSGGYGGSLTLQKEKNKIPTQSLLEKTQDERRAKLNLNFGHAQYKLDRIALRVDSDILPRQLRTKLSPVSFQDLAAESLQLGVTQPSELFDTKGGHLSPLGIAPPTPIILPLQKQSYSAQQLAKKFKRDIRTAPHPHTSLTRSSSKISTSIDLPVLAKTSLPISHQSSAATETRTIPSSTSSRSDVGEPITQVLQHEEGEEEEEAEERIHFHLHDNDEENSEDYLKNCALCLHRFPTRCLQNKVLLKHVVSLRNIWDPSLVSKFMGDLMLGMSLFNLVPVCIFCSQYFNPDCEDGISPPPVAVPEAKKPENKYGNKKDILTEFYDSRYSGMKSAGDLLHDPLTIETRERAKRAIQISREIKRQQLMK